MMIQRFINSSSLQFEAPALWIGQFCHSKLLISIPLPALTILYCTPSSLYGSDASNVTIPMASISVPSLFSATMLLSALQIT